jgi:hypothetical protein
MASSSPECSGYLKNRTLFVGGKLTIYLFAIPKFLLSSKKFFKFGNALKNLSIRSNASCLLIFSLSASPWYVNPSIYYPISFLSYSSTTSIRLYRSLAYIIIHKAYGCRALVGRLLLSLTTYALHLIVNLILLLSWLGIVHLWRSPEFTRFYLRLDFQ